MFTQVGNLVRMLTARQWWQIGGLALLLALLWSIGLWVSWSTTMLLAGTVLLLVVAILALLMEHIRAARGAAALEKSMRGQAEDALFSLKPERREQIEQIETEFSAALESLKRSKLGKGARGQSALYALPWYVVIGPPAAGKTTAITASGLDFPLGTNRVRGVGGTRNCDWFFSTSAILLDTAGRYTTVSEDREEWFKFLDLLKKHRRRTPVNGVIAMVSIDELLNSTPEELERCAADLRNRVNELTERLGVRFPVYLVFTKCDLIRGFVDFFADLTRKEREQVWGCTFTKETDKSQSHFAGEFNVLVQALVERRLARLTSTPAATQETGEIYLFPLEFAAVGHVLSRFVAQLFLSNPYHDNPDFRGFYFTSALQEGRATDRVLGTITGSFDLSDWKERPPARVESKSSFLVSLFTDVIIGDRHRVAPTSRAATTREMVRRTAIAAIIVLFAAFSWVAGSAFARSSADIGIVRRAVESTDRAANLASLRPLDTAISSLEHSLAGPRRLRQLGLDRSEQFLSDLDALFVRRVTPLLTDGVFRPIEARLRMISRRDTSADVRAKAHNDLRAYQLLGDEVRRLREDTAERILLEGYLRRLSTAQAADSVFMSRFVKALRTRVMSTDTQVVKHAQSILYTPPTLEGLYRSLRDEGGRLPPLTLTRLIGNPPNSPYERGAPILGLYTKYGWEEFVQRAIEQRSLEPGKTDWVVGSKPDDLPAELTDPDRVAERLLAWYFSDYIREWRRFLVGVRYNSGDAATVMRQFEGLAEMDRSALVTLLDSVTAQTRFENPTVAGAKQKMSSFIASMFRKFGYEQAPGSTAGSGHPVDRAFASIHALTEGNGRAVLGQILLQYQGFGQTMQVMGGDAPTTEVANQLSTDAMRARVNISQWAKTLDPDVRSALFEQPFVIAQRVIGVTTVGVLGRDWREEVCKPFQTTLAGKYPFDPKATTDASITDVERFFQPQTGTIWAFYENELSGFLRPSDFQPPAGRPGAFSVSSAVVSSLRRAKFIREGLFSGGGGVHLEFDLEPRAPIVDSVTGPRRAVTEVCMAIDGNRQCYRMGAQSPQTFTWPSKSGPPGARITVAVSEGGRPAPELVIESPGDWGWLRLLDRAALLSQLSGGRYRLEWRVAPEGGDFSVRVVYNLQVKSSQSLFDNIKVFSQFYCPPGLQ